MGNLYHLEFDPTSRDTSVPKCLSVCRPNRSFREYFFLPVSAGPIECSSDNRFLHGGNSVYLRSLVRVAIVRRFCSASYHRTHLNSPMSTSKRRLSSHSHARGSSHVFMPQTPFGEPEIVQISTRRLVAYRTRGPSRYLPNLAYAAYQRSREQWSILRSATRYRTVLAQG